MDTSPANDVLPSDWWTAEDCGRYLGITASTWRAYVARDQAPKADRRFGRATVWLPATVKEWARARPRRPDTSGD